MSISPPPSPSTPAERLPEPLQAIACPACFGAVAVGPDLLGRAAECPLCGTGFRVPGPGLGDPPPQASASSFTGPSRKRPRPSQGSQRTPPPAAPGRREPGEPTAAFPYDPPREAAAAAAGAAEAEAADADADAAEESPVEPAPTEGLQFREPVRTVVSGDHVITLRRLTPREKAARRGRRNVVMLLAGLSILMAIVLLLGRKRQGHRSRQ